MKAFLIAPLAAALFASLMTFSGGDVFDAADANGDEVLSFEEFKAIEPDTTQAEFQLLDANADGLLDFDEYELGVQAGYLQAH